MKFCHYLNSRKNDFSDEYTNQFINYKQLKKKLYNDEIFFKFLDNEVNKVNLFVIGMHRVLLSSKSNTTENDHIILKEFCHLNALGLRKILKKHDKKNNSTKGADLLDEKYRSLPFISYYSIPLMSLRVTTNTTDCQKCSYPMKIERKLSCGHICCSECSECTESENTIYCPICKKDCLCLCETENPRNQSLFRKFYNIKNKKKEGLLRSKSFCF